MTAISTPSAVILMAKPCAKSMVEPTNNASLEFAARASTVLVAALKGLRRGREYGFCSAIQVLAHPGSLISAKPSVKPLGPIFNGAHCSMIN